MTDSASAAAPDAGDPGSASQTAGPLPPLTPALIGATAVLVLQGLAALALWFLMDVRPGDPAAFGASSAALLVVGFCAMAAGPLVLIRQRYAFILGSALMWPLLVAQLWLALMWALQAPLPGGGTTLGVFGLASLVLTRVFATQIRRYELVRALVPEVVKKAKAGFLGYIGLRAVVSAPSHEEVSDHWVRDHIESVIFALVMALVIRTFALEAFKIPTGSMKPTLDGDNYSDEADTRMVRSGDKILVNKLAYLIGEPDRWDIAVFKFPLNTKRNFIKRVTGIENELLLVYGGEIWTRPVENGEPAGPWVLQRKPDDVQNQLWMPVWFMAHSLLDEVHEDSTAFGEDIECGRFGISRDPSSPEGPESDWIHASTSFDPEFYGDADTPRRVYWHPPVSSGARWTAAGEIDGLRTDGTAGPGFHAAPGEEWSRIGFKPVVWDTYAVPRTEADYEEYDASDRTALHPRFGTNRQVGDVRLDATVRLDAPESRLRISLWRGVERLELVLGGDGTAELRLHATRPDWDPGYPPTAVNVRTPDSNGAMPLAEAMAHRGVSIGSGAPFRLAFSNGDRQARIEIDGVPVYLPGWSWQPARASRPDVLPEGGDWGSQVDEALERMPTTISMSARGGAVDVGDIVVSRDIHYFFYEYSPDPLLIPRDHFLMMGDNAHNSKDSRQWYTLTLHCRTDDGVVRIPIEPDPADEAQGRDRGRDVNLDGGPTSPGGHVMYRRTDPYGRLMIAGGLAGATQHGMDELLHNLRAQMSSRPDSSRLLRVEDTSGVVRLIDPMAIERMELARTPFVPRENLIGRALLRFWPIAKRGFIH